MQNKRNIARGLWWRNAFFWTKELDEIVQYNCNATRRVRGLALLLLQKASNSIDINLLIGIGGHKLIDWDRRKGCGWMEDGKIKLTCCLYRTEWVWESLLARGKAFVKMSSRESDTFVWKRLGYKVFARCQNHTAASWSCVWKRKNVCNRVAYGQRDHFYTSFNNYVFWKWPEYSNISFIPYFKTYKRVLVLSVTKTLHKNHNQLSRKWTTSACPH